LSVVRCSTRLAVSKTLDEQFMLQAVIERSTKKFPSATRAEIDGAVAVDDLALTDNPADGR